MDSAPSATLLLAALGSIAAWIILLVARGGFWRDGPFLESDLTVPESWPRVVAIVPARNEADSIAACVASLLAQDYPGGFSVVVVDDRSDDGTAECARAMATGPHTLHIVGGTPLPTAWTGKLWAVEQGLNHARDVVLDAAFYWLTDADIVHAPNVLRTLVAKSERDSLGLVSQMVMLRCEGAWERLLIPAFVFFFKKLYPFDWVNDRRRRAAAAAGGCVLVRARVLDSIGGIAAIRNEIIDDCALARAVKPHQPIWLGLTHASRSLRRYDRLGDIWAMVTRTAFVQLHRSYLLVVATVLSMSLVYLVPPVATLIGIMFGDTTLTLAGIAGWLLMASAFRPTLRLYAMSGWKGLQLPLAALLYTSMTVASAWHALVGQGAPWKNRRYVGDMGAGAER